MLPSTCRGGPTAAVAIAHCSLRTEHEDGAVLLSLYGSWLPLDARVKQNPHGGPGGTSQPSPGRWSLKQGSGPSRSPALGAKATPGSRRLNVTGCEGAEAAGRDCSYSGSPSDPAACGADAADSHSWPRAPVGPEALRANEEATRPLLRGKSLGRTESDTQPLCCPESPRPIPTANFLSLREVTRRAGCQACLLTPMNRPLLSDLKRSYIFLKPQNLKETQRRYPRRTG